MSEERATFLDQHKEAALAPFRPSATPSEPPKIVKVFVRLGDDEHERTIAFRIPDGIDPLDLLERGATIDGNQAILAVAWEGDTDGVYTCPDLSEPSGDFEGKSLTRVLGDCQRGLVKFLKSQGYAVRFA